jgi:hypothetical protein
MGRFPARQVVAGLCARGRSANQSWRARCTTSDDGPHGFVAASNPLLDELQLALVKRPHFVREGSVLWNADTVELPTVLEIEAEGAVTNDADGKLLEVQDRRLTPAMPEESGAILLYTRPPTQTPH